MEAREKKYKQLYMANYPKVMRLCMGYTCGNQAFAKDLAQETFLKVWQNLDGFRNESNMATWIYRICVNTCLAVIKKEKKNSFTLSLNEEQINGAQEDYDNEKLFKKLYSCISKLTATNKAIILLELEEMPQQEIAAVMGLKHEAIRTRIHRIKNQLTKCVRHE